MIAELKSAVAAEQPMLMMLWQPHWIHNEIGLNVVAWDFSSPDCLAGSSQSKGDACGFAQASVEKIVSRDFAENWPAARGFVEKYQMTNAIQNALIAKVDQGGMSIEEAVAEWMAENEDTWRAWTN